MKKLSKILLMSLSILLILSTFVFASSKISILLNGEYVKLDVDPEMINNRTMIPLRAVLEGIGATVTWDNKTKTAIAETETEKIEIQINTNVIKKTNLITGETQNITIDQAAIMKNSRTLIPVRFVVESLGSKVFWDGNEKTVIILDRNKYKTDYENKWKNLFELMKYKYPEDQTLESAQTNKISLSMESSAENIKAKVDATVDTKINIEADRAASLEFTINFDLDDVIKEQLELFLGIDLDVKDTKIKLYFDREKMFVSTNIFRLLNLEEQMQKALNDEGITDFQIVDLYDGVYARYDDMLSEKQEEIDEIIDELFNSRTQVEQDIDDVLEQIISNVNVTNAEEAKQINAIFEIISVIFSDEYLNITSDKVTYNFNKDDIKGFLESIKKNIEPYVAKEDYEKMIDDTNLEKIKNLEISVSNNIKDNIFTNGDYKVILKVAFEYLDSTYTIDYNMSTTSKATNSKIFVSEFPAAKNIGAFVKKNINNID